MNPNIPSIDQLKEIALPAPVSYAPQTWGVVGVAWFADDRCFTDQRKTVLAVAAGPVSARGVGAVG